jgi:hypothetical protein
MTHFRTYLYDATKELLTAECAEDVGGRAGWLHGLVLSDNIYIEAGPSVSVNTRADAMRLLPLVNLVMPSARRERGTLLVSFDGSTSIDIEVLVSGDDGETAARSRDEICDRIETALVASEVLVGPEGRKARWIAGPWKLLGIDDRIAGREGGVLLSSATLSLAIEFKDTKTIPAEDAFGGLDIDVATREPDDDTVEMQFKVDLEIEGEEEEEP